MNKEEIISKVLSDENSFAVKSAEELEALLDKELSKRDNEIDYELVNELTLAAIEARGDKPIENNIEEKLKELKAVESREKKRFRLPKRSVGLAAACVMLMCTNVVSVSAWDMNIFSLIVELTKGGAKIDFGNKREEIILPTSEDDPYGIIAKCNEVGINVETPHYLPEEFVLTVVENNKYEWNNYLFFRYENDKKFITISYETYSEEFAINIPSDEHNISEIEINGHSAIVSKEDNQMIVVFRSRNYIINIFTQDVDYDECEKIIQSVK